MSMRFLTMLPPAALCLSTIAAPALAQAVPAECRALVDAEKKLITTPHRAYETETTAGGGAPATHQLITAGGANYILHEGKWRRSPMTPQMLLDQMNENIANAKVLSCKRVGDDAVAGEAAIVYTSHTVSDEITADARIWVSKSAGLPLRNEQDLDTGGGDKRHISIRYEFSDVKAPAGVK